MRYQPQSRPRLDPGNPFVKDLLIAVVPGCLYNLVDGAPLTPFSGTTVAGRAFGNAITAGSYDFPLPANASSQWVKYDIFVLTALVVATQDSSQNTNLAFYRGNGSSGATWGIGLHGGSNNDAYAQMGGGSYVYTAIGQFDPKKPRVAVLTADGSTARVYLDGQFRGSGAYTQTAPQYSAARQVRFGSLGGSNAVQTTRPGLGLLFKRALSDAEVKALSDNPWQVFAEDEDDEFIYAASLSGAGGATDTAVSPGAGSFAITGYAPTVSQPQSITTGTGSIAITGYAPTVTQGATTAVVPGVGSLTLTGYAPSVAQSTNQALIPAAGALSISGYAPSVTQSANQAVTPNTGALSITGYAPTITQASASQNIVPGAGQLTITGYEPTVTQSGGAGRRKKFQVETSRGIIEVDTLDEVAQIARVEKRTPKAPAIAVKLDGVKVSTPSLKPNVDYKSIEARMRAQVQAEMDEEEELLMMLL